MLKTLKGLKYKQIKKQAGLCGANEKGISLVEVLVSIFLLALVLTSLTKIYYYANSQINISRHKTMAINLMQANFENLLSLSFLGINTSDYPVISNVTIDPGASAATSDDVTGTMTTQLVNLNTDEGYKFITTTTWDESYGLPGRTLTEVAELLLTDHE